MLTLAQTTADVSMFHHFHPLSPVQRGVVQGVRVPVLLPPVLRLLVQHQGQDPAPAAPHTAHVHGTEPRAARFDQQQPGQCEKLQVSGKV